MAITKCKECGAQISTKAQSCPSCGAKIKKRMGIIGWAFAIIALLAIARCATDVTSRKAPPPPPPKSAEQLEREHKQELAFQLDLALVKMLRSTLKNPASFELVEAGRVDDRVLCVVYRGTNGFNAVITEMRAINRSNAATLDWNKACANKKADDVSRLRHAL